MVAEFRKRQTGGLESKKETGNDHQKGHGSRYWVEDISGSGFIDIY